MSGIAFEWDFAEATTVFDDPLSITIPDPDHAADEERFVIVGMSSERSLLVVVHTIRGERIRLISARSATKHEKRDHEETSL
jgi:hypothetical protein